MFSRMFSVQSGEGRVLVSPNNETRTWTLCRMSVLFFLFIIVWTFVGNTLHCVLLELDD